jgi:signal transduction histidine kinase
LWRSVEHTGADRALLFWYRNGKHEIEAEATIAQSEVRICFSKSFGRLPNYPKSVLRYLNRMEESVALRDATDNHQFFDDDYFRSEPPRSIIGVPVMIRREFVGALYLESSQMHLAFTTDLVASLELLAQWTAIAIGSASSASQPESERRVKPRRRQATTSRAHENRQKGLTEEIHRMQGMVAALTHELRQPLEAILGNAEAALDLLRTPRPDLAEAGAALEDVVRDVFRAVAAERSVRAIFERQPLSMISLDLGEILRHVGDLVRNEAAVGEINLKLCLPKSLPRVHGNRSQLTQAFLNIITNAFESVLEVKDRQREVIITASHLKPGLVRVAICDSGSGVDPQILPRMFIDFFTTKDRGMGMGLSIVRSIVLKHGGRIWASPNRDHGMTFEIELSTDKLSPRSQG